MEKANHKPSILKIIISVIIILLLALYIIWGEYKLNLSSQKIEELKVANESYNKELYELKGIYASSTAAFDDLYQTLTTVINEEGLKNKTLEEKVNSLDKVVRSDPQLLKKYSKVYFLNENYRPQELQAVAPQYTLDKNRVYMLHVNVMYFLVNMIEDAKKEGLDLLVGSAYRSFQDQTSLKSRNVVVYGANTANKFSAEQGYSEHQLGTAIDFTTSNLKQISIAFDKTKEYIWMQNNAHRYGFILSYPKGNNYYIYEPWHWRFVGVSLAKHIYENKLNFHDLDQVFIDGYLIDMFEKEIR